jgi:hypothetical protein
VQPTSFRIARSRTMAATPSAIRAVLSDVRGFQAGDALARVGPHVTVTYSPVTVGPGAWVESHDDWGTGRRTLVTSTDALVEFRTGSGADDRAMARYAFELAPVAGGTEVTLSLSNELTGLARALWPFVGLEGRIAPGMEDTLRRLEAAVLAR